MSKFRIHRHIHRLCIATLLLGSIATSRGVPKPNIVLILADDVGCEPIGCYGGESFATPNIDALAKNGMKFEHCYSMPVCHPSRIALMTGRYPFRFKASWGSFPKNEEKHSIGGYFYRSVVFPDIRRSGIRQPRLRGHPSATRGVRPGNSHNRRLQQCVLRLALPPAY